MTIEASLADHIKTRAKGLGGPQYNAAYTALMKAFGVMNGVNYSMSLFGPQSLMDHKAYDQSTELGSEDLHSFRLHGGDHLACFKRDRRPVAIVAEPYRCDPGYGEFTEYVTSMGLVVHTPPTPLQGIYFPGQTAIFVVTRRDFGSVKWLPEQVAVPRNHD